MRIRAGFDISYDCYQPTPMLLLISIHPSRAPDLVTQGAIHFSPGTTVATYQDRYDVLTFLLGSRYCETDRLTDTAWSLFGHIAPGWSRVEAICTYVHEHIKFDYQQARSTRTAWEGYQERVGVCRDFAHLAVAFCRCMNIPARYCTGYLGDIGVPRVDAPGDFSAWFEVYLGGRWYTFDARHNARRIGRILMARGRDATDVAISNSFGPAPLANFFVFTDEVP